MLYNAYADGSSLFYVTLPLSTNPIDITQCYCPDGIAYLKEVTEWIDLIADIACTEKTIDIGGLTGVFPVRIVSHNDTIDIYFAFTGIATRHLLFPNIDLYQEHTEVHVIGGGSVRVNGRYLLKDSTK